MEDQRLTEALEAMNRLRAGLELRRQGEAAELEAICDLAVAYRVDEQELGEYVMYFDREPQKYLAEKSTHPGDEGTPDVSEFLPLEISALLRCSELSAVRRVGTALNLKYRCPAIYEAILNGEVEYWVGEKACEIVKDLTPDLAERVTTRWLVLQYGMTPAFALKDLRKLVLQADPQTAAQQEREAREVRGVWFRDVEPGVTSMSGRVDVLQGRIIDERLGQIARRLKDRYPDLSHDARRARALFLAMNPVVLISELGDGVDQPCLDWFSEPEYQPDLDKLTAEKVATTIDLVIHISATDEGTLDPAAEIERGALLTTALLGELLGEGYANGDFAIKVQPVIDLNHQAGCDGYQPTDRMRRAVQLAFPREVFPFSTRTGGLDLDHIEAYITGRCGQTHLHNLAPLTRRVHRAKTAGWWLLRNEGPGHWQWRSPLGYIYEVTDGGSWLTCTPDLGAPKPPPPLTFEKPTWDFGPILANTA